ncbi:hypothetical protein AKJ09_09305 [Labilithrix luteola]|uniref:HTH marR-type domain-containing protein n=2 Tax=Labilithrix luteola TaxID=1391654 RepID=A0A0K1QAD8_9BACT|nr:hypothetical protein AKJ09_09305 [Labilithrix luteola]
MSIRSDHDESERPLLTLLSIAAQRQRERLLVALEARGFEGIAMPEVRLAKELEQRGPSSIQTLADATETTKQFCAREVKKLERGGYVVSKASQGDRRVTLVGLAPKGQRLLEAVHDVKSELDGGIAEKLGGPNATRLRTLLERLVESSVKD